MTKKRKISIAILVLILGGLLFFEGRRITFSMDSFAAETELKQNFEDNKSAFTDFATFVNRAAPIEFRILTGDTIYMKFQATSIQLENRLLDKSYGIGPASTSEFLIDENNCLEVVKMDTIKDCSDQWKVEFYGDYKDKRIDQLLSYSAWTRNDFEHLVQKVQALNCSSFEKSENDFTLSYKMVYYYDDQVFHCFGHSDGHFDYLYTNQPDRFYLKSSLKELEGNYYGIEHWNF